eukprot:TRINITY_DN22879_c0_g1_i1.p1 TRINITY_DN22879_c0_g1~~TRINITY_DN22879_c0_g1_i1.p1  ORF type:complete len:387 (+),score=71.37 TRINITY_DN22879_c0_g1_i1:134-1294(+)
MEGLEGTPCNSGSLIARGVERCPFLRNITKPTNFSFAGSGGLDNPVPKGSARGPIFEDGPSFEHAFRLFHGHNGVVPLSRATVEAAVAESIPSAGSSCFASGRPKTEPTPYHVPPTAASAATISLSAFGPSGPFGFDSFMSADILAKKFDHKPESHSDAKKDEVEHEMQSKQDPSGEHQAMSNEWLESGKCPIAKSYRALNAFLPLVAAALQPPANVKFICPPAIVAARAALARTPAVKALRPQHLSAKVLAIGGLGLAVNIPLGVWREHTKKFSPQWFLAVHASIPMVAMMRKAVLMPKYAMVFTIAAAIIGQAIGARAERARLLNSKLHPDSGLVPLESGTRRPGRQKKRQRDTFTPEPFQQSCGMAEKWDATAGNQAGPIPAC